MDKRTITAPVATIEIDTPFLKGSVRAICLNDAAHDLLIGNVEQARDPNAPDESWSCNTEDRSREFTTVTQQHHEDFRRQVRQVS